MNPDDTPAHGVEVLIEPGRVIGFTAANGMAKLTINTEARTDRLTVTVSKMLYIFALQPICQMVACRSEINQNFHIILL